MTEPLAVLTIGSDARGGTLVAIVGEIDLSNADDLLKRVERAAREATSLAVDLSGVRYIDSQGVRLLVSLTELASPAPLRIVAPAHSVAAEVLAITGLDAHLDVRTALDDAAGPDGQDVAG